MNDLEKYKNFIITKNTEYVLFNVDLIGRYLEKIRDLRNHKYAKYFKNDIKKYEKIISKLEKENNELVNEIEEVKELKAEV